MKTTLMRDKLFIDTVFVQALLNSRDQYHLVAQKLYPRLLSASRLFITNVILIEIGDALSALNRQAANDFIEDCRSRLNLEIVQVDETLFEKGFEIYQKRQDKTWSLTDCLSFVVMQENKLRNALTSDQHFVQAGFHALMLEAN